MRQAPLAWEQARKRLQASEDSLREALSETPGRIETVFRQRAAQLAKERAEDKPASRGISVLIFRLAQEQYAIALKELAEVLPGNGCTPVPGAGPQFLGVLNLRGKLVVVIDLARVLSGGSTDDAGAVLVLHSQVGLKVDYVEDLREIQPQEFAPNGHGRYIRGLAPGPLMVLDVEALLSAEFTPKER